MTISFIKGLLKDKSLTLLCMMQIGAVGSIIYGVKGLALMLPILIFDKFLLPDTVSVGDRAPDGKVVEFKEHGERNLLSY